MNTVHGVDGFVLGPDGASRFVHRFRQLLQGPVRDGAGDELGRRRVVLLLLLQTRGIRVVPPDGGAAVAPRNRVDRRREIPIILLQG